LQLTKRHTRLWWRFSTNGVRGVRDIRYLYKTKQFTSSSPAKAR
jgi:hypothetical protein